MHIETSEMVEGSDPGMVARSAIRSQAARLGFLGALILILAGCGGGSVPARLKIGEPMPGFSLEALDGSKVDSGSLAGKPVVLNFWATWCQPCLKEIPELIELAEGGVQVVGIALDEEGARTVQPFVQSHGMRYTILLGNQKVFLSMGGIGIPYTLVLDSSLRVANIYRGVTTREKIEQDVNRVSTS